MEQMKEFNGIFGTLRTIMHNGEPWFCAMDITKCLCFTNGRKAVEDHCKPNGVTKRYSIDAIGRERQLTYINESNLYRLITHSKLPTAEKFESWVFDEVLPDIRKQGFYATIPTVENFLNNPDHAIQMLTAYKAEKAARLQAENECKELAEENEELRQSVAELESEKVQNEPKVKFAEAVESSNCDMLIYDFAKVVAQQGIDIGGKRLFEWFRQMAYLCRRRGSKNAPTLKSIKGGYFKVIERGILHNNGKLEIVCTTKITPKGQLYFINRLTKEFGAKG